MTSRLVITDLTHMWGDEVCIVGMDRNGQCIRLVTQSGVKRDILFRSHLFRRAELLIYPRAIIDIDLYDAPNVIPPHVEDNRFDPKSIANCGTCSDAQWETVLKTGLFASVSEIFDGLLEGDRQIPPRSKTRSLGTISDVEIVDLEVDDRFDRQSYRLLFRDGTGKLYKKPVNDLAFRSCFERSNDMLGDESEAAQSMLEQLQASERTYLRIGLTRPTQLGSYPEACWTQVTGVYTFPDYLDGRTFADFS